MKDQDEQKLHLGITHTLQAVGLLGSEAHATVVSVDLKKDNTFEIKGRMAPGVRSVPDAAAKEKFIRDATAMSGGKILYADVDRMLSSPTDITAAIGQALRPQQTFSPGFSPRFAATPKKKGPSRTKKKKGRLKHKREGKKP